MRIAQMNWMQVQERVARDDRCVLPIGSVEQHAYLSLCVDMILAEKVSVDAAEPLGVPVYPALPYGTTPYFSDFPGTVSLRLSTYIALFEDLLESVRRSGFRRIVVVNGHGGNSAVSSLAAELMAEHPRLQVKLHNWWNAPRTWAVVRELEPQSAHASWMENLPWTRVAGAPSPAAVKPPVDLARYRLLAPREARELAGDGNFGGSYARPDADVLRLWEAAVQETRELIEGPWR